MAIFGTSDSRARIRPGYNRSATSPKTEPVSGQFGIPGQSATLYRLALRCSGFSAPPYVDKKTLALDYFNPYEGKIISDIRIKALDVFGPSFSDTLKTADKWMERAANAVHTKSNLRTIEKLLLFKVGDVLDPELMYENERIIRQLSYIRDVKFEVEQDSS